MSGSKSFYSFLVKTAFRPWIWQNKPLNEADMLADPFDLFGNWFETASHSFWIEFPEAMCISTIDLEGYPDSRMVLLKDFDHSGFVFYTNTNSTKGKSLAGCPRAALNFHWEPLKRQVRIQGETEAVTDQEADAYFATRPRGSQIGAWASHQSQPLATRAELQARTREIEAKYAGKDVPRPPHWSGYRVKPHKIEFWQMRASRLHDRFVYRKQSDGSWSITRLNP